MKDVTLVPPNGLAPLRAMVRRPRSAARKPELGVVQAGNVFTPLPRGVRSFLGDVPTW
jgi:hypothetical protein